MSAVFSGHDISVFQAAYYNLRVWHNRIKKNTAFCLKKIKNNNDKKYIYINIYIYIEREREREGGREGERERGREGERESEPIFFITNLTKTAVI